MELIEQYVIVSFFSLIIGIYIARIYYQRTIRNASLGKIIELSMVEKSIQELESQIKILNDTISNLKDIGGELEVQIKNSQDIEKSYSDKFEIQEEIDIKDVLENEA